MPDFDYTEKRFEQDVEEYLLTRGGYLKGDPKRFDRKPALDTETFLTFLKISQPKADEKIFQSVIIITDRRVPDSQLQNTINDGVPIITTLQKFPVICREVKSGSNLKPCIPTTSLKKLPSCWTIS